MVDLSFTQKLRIKLFGYVSVGYRMKEGWKTPIKHYAFKCPKHDIVIDYAHGFPRYPGDIGKLDCMECFEEKRKRAKEAKEG